MKPTLEKTIKALKAEPIITITAIHNKDRKKADIFKNLLLSGIVVKFGYSVLPERRCCHCSCKKAICCVCREKK